MGRRKTLKAATGAYKRLDGLKTLAQILAEQIDVCDDQKTLASLARQYRETMADIDAIEGGADDEDGISAIIIRNRQSGAH